MNVDPLQVSLEDHELNEEIRLLTELILLATESEGALDQHRVDALLGPRKG